MLGFLNPLFAGAAMAFSSVFVVSNSLRLRRFQALRSDQPTPIERPVDERSQLPETAATR